MFKAIDKLCRLKNPFSSERADRELFNDAMRENYRFQLEKQPFLRYMADRDGFDVENGNVENIPPLFVDTMKIHTFSNIRDDEIALLLTSSGTKGQKTQTILDEGSLERIKILARSTFEAMGFANTKPVHYFMFSYDIRKAGNVGTSWSDEQIMSLAPGKSVHWLIEWDEKRGAYHFDSDKWAQKFLELHEDAPVRMLGFPAFMYEIVEKIHEITGNIKVDPASFIIAGGGWKNHRGTPMSINDFARHIEKRIGLPAENIRDTYGMAEHGVPYCSCSHGHLHVPIFGKLVVRDPLTMEKRSYGEEGMLQLLTPYCTSQPNLSILSTDLVVLGRDCPCGKPGDYMVSIRRGGVRKHKGCAIAAQEILDKSAKQES